MLQGLADQRRSFRNFQLGRKACMMFLGEFIDEAGIVVFPGRDFEFVAAELCNGEFGKPAIITGMRECICLKFRRFWRVDNDFARELVVPI